MSGEITKEAVSLMRRAAEITGNEEIKFAAAHIQSEYDKKHPRQLQASASGAIKKLEKPLNEPAVKKQLPRSVSAPNVSSEEFKKKVDSTNRVGPIQSQLPRKRWTPQVNAYPRANATKATRIPLESSLSQRVTREEAARLQSIADRTKNPELKSLSKKLQHMALYGEAEPHNVRFTMADAAKLESLASKSGNKELDDVARYVQSVASSEGVGLDLGQSELLSAICKPEEFHLQNPTTIAELKGEEKIEENKEVAPFTLGGFEAEIALVASEIEKEIEREIIHVIKDDASELQSLASKSGDPELKELAKEAQSAADILAAGVGAS